MILSCLLLQTFSNVSNSFLNGINSCVTNCGMVHRVVHSVLLLYGRFPATVFGDTGVGTLLGEGSFQFICEIRVPNCLFAFAAFSFISSMILSCLLLQTFSNVSNSFLNGINSCVTNCGMVHRVAHLVLFLYGRFPATVFRDTGVGALLGEGSFPLGDVS